MKDCTESVCQLEIPGIMDILASHPDSDLVFGHSEGRKLLVKALASARERVIIVCPWLSLKSISDQLLYQFSTALRRGINIDIGWGYYYDIGTIIKFSESGKYFIDAVGDEWRKYNALPPLAQLRSRYPQGLNLKLMGTHAKYITCDRLFAYVNHCLEAGTLHKDPWNIQKLINHFDHQPPLSKSGNWQRSSA